MKSENIITALNDIDPELVEDAVGQHKPSQKAVLLKWGAVAAVLCLIFTLALGYFLSNPQQPILGSMPSVATSTPTFLVGPDPPVYAGIVYTAEEIAGFFDTHKGETTSYTEFYVPSSEYLQLHDKLDSPFYALYQYSIPDIELNAGEFRTFLDPKLSRIASELGITSPQYTIGETSVGYTDHDLVVNIFDMEGYWLTSFHNAVSNSITLSSTSDSGIMLGDVRIEVDQTKSDQEIIASLSKIKGKLFALFDVSFSNVKIVRHYDDYNNHGVTWLEVYFYNVSGHPLNFIADGPYSDYISLEFDNRDNFADEDDVFVSDTVLENVTIRYRQLRSNAQTIYRPTMSVPLISLQEAEIFLGNGYVFGGHSCPICMSEQAAVDFSDYDFVDIVYIQSVKLYEGPKDIIPFYAFYKKIGTAQNGNEIYAKTYVPAIRVSGYEEYFKSQEAEHRN